MSLSDVSSETLFQVTEWKNQQQIEGDSVVSIQDHKSKNTYSDARIVVWLPGLEAAIDGYLADARLFLSNTREHLDDDQSAITWLKSALTNLDMGVQASQLETLSVGAIRKASSPMGRAMLTHASGGCCPFTWLIRKR